MRGDEDWGPISLEKPKKKDGKLRALLRFRVQSGDNNLKKHLENHKKNASYLSPDIQNEVIDIAGKIVLKILISKVNRAEVFR